MSYIAIEEESDPIKQLNDKGDQLIKGVDELKNAHVKDRKILYVGLAILLLALVGVGSVIYNVYWQVPAARQDSRAILNRINDCIQPGPKGHPHKCYAELRKQNQKDVGRFLIDLRNELQTVQNK